VIRDLVSNPNSKSRNSKRKNVFVKHTGTA
jgi:hypothetical protein